MTFRETMARDGLNYTGEIQADGKLHRFRAEGDKQRNSWYVLYNGTIAAGAFGCWKRGFTEKWQERQPKDQEETKRFHSAIADAKAKAEADRQRQREYGQRTLARWISRPQAQPAAASAYIQRKQVRPSGSMYFSNGRLVVPLVNAEGRVCSVQFIHDDGTKLYLPGLPVAGLFYHIHGYGSAVYVCEGIATGLTVASVTGCEVYCAMTAGNLLTVAKMVRERHTAAEIVLAADNDQFTPDNPGLTKATEAAKAIGARLAVPSFTDTATKPTDFNDLAFLAGREETKRQLTISNMSTPAADIHADMIAILSNGKLGQNEKRTAIAELVRTQLKVLGSFYYNLARRDFETAMFFSKQRHQLMRIRSDSFIAWLSNWLKVNRSDPLYRYIMAEIETAALSDEHSQGIEPEVFWARRAGAVYISNGDASMVRIGRGFPEIIPNGSDGVLFATGETLKPWQLVEPKDPFETCSLFSKANCASPHGLDLLRVFMLGLPTAPPCKPPLCISGVVGSGKTRQAKGIAEFYGIPFIASKVEESGEDNFWVSLDAGGLFTLDNADTRNKWLADAIASASTDGCVQRRRLYTDAEKLVLRPKAWLCVTTANPTFASDAGLADRLLVVRMERRTDETEDSRLSEEIAENRDAGLSYVVQTLALAMNDKKPTPAGLNYRHPDFAAMAVRIGRAIRREQQVVAALRRAEEDKSSFCVENHWLGPALTQVVSECGRFHGDAEELTQKLQAADSELRERLTARKLGKQLLNLWPHIEKVFHANRERGRGGTWVYTLQSGSNGGCGGFQEAFSTKPLMK